MRVMRFAALMAAVVIGAGSAEAQALRVGISPPLPNQVLFQKPAIEAVAKDAGLQITIMEMPFGDLLNSLTSNKIDIIASVVTPTPERMKVADFSQSYGSYRDVAMVPASDNKAYKSVDDFKGLNVSVVRGAFYVDPLKKAGANVLEVETSDQQVEQLNSGKVVAAFSTRPTIGYLVASNPKYKIVDTYPAMLNSDVAFGVQKGNADLLAKLNASLTKLKANGTIRPLAEKAGYSYP